MGWSDEAIISKLCQDFPSLSTMNIAREELNNLYQEPSETITVFINKYGQMHYVSTGIRADRETHPFTITGFIAALDPKLNKMVVRRYTDGRDKPDTLAAIFHTKQIYIVLLYSLLNSSFLTFSADGTPHTGVSLFPGNQATQIKISHSMF